jgi:hypothetical protein
MKPMSIMLSIVWVSASVVAIVSKDHAPIICALVFSMFATGIYFWFRVRTGYEQ